MKNLIITLLEVNVKSIEVEHLWGVFHGELKNVIRGLKNIYNRYKIHSIECKI